MKRVCVCVEEGEDWCLQVEKHPALFESDQPHKHHDQLTGAHQPQRADKSQLKMQLYDNSHYNSIQGNNSGPLKNGNPIATHLSTPLA